jgi:AcrR family transcriptional regulator
MVDRPAPDSDPSGAARRRGQKVSVRSERAHQSIMNATIDVLRDVGYHALTFEQVATRAGSSKATVYRWWPNNAALTVAAITSRVNVPPVKATGEIRIDMRAVIQAAYDTLVRSPLGEILPALAVDLLRDPDAADALAEYLRPRRESVTAIIDGAAARGDLPADTDASVLLDIYAGTILYRTLVSRSPADTLVDQLTALILDRELPRSPGRADSVQ